MKKILLILLLPFFANVYAQQSVSTTFSNQNNPSSFREKVRFGGGLGLGFGNNVTNISLSPQAIVEINEFYAVGLGLQGSYLQQRDRFESFIYGANLIQLLNPVPFLQLSAELEQLRVNTTNKSIFGPNTKDQFWNTGLFLGAGYRSRNITLGVRYNVLSQSDRVYATAWMPFVRAFF